MTKDVVCGMDVDENSAPARSEYKGKTYYFCNTSCYEKFKSNPEKYLTSTSESKNTHQEKKSHSQDQSSDLKIDIPITGMSCASCAQTIENSLNNLKEVHYANVNFANESATVSFSHSVPFEKIKKAIENSGYGIKEKNIILQIGGMSCASCAQTIERALNKTQGITEAHINFATEKAFVKYIPGMINSRQIIKTIENTGYSVIDKNEEKDSTLQETEKAKKRLIQVLWLSTPVIILMILKMAFRMNIPFYYPIEMILSTLVLAIPGFTTLKSGTLSLLHKSANMDVLIMLGTVASLFTGILKLLGTPIESFAGVGAMIMAVHLIGRYIESSAKGRASEAIKKLLDLGAKTAKILKEGTETEIPIELLQPNDIMVIRPGEKIPTDGIIIKGEAEIDESMVTGESMPVKRKEQDAVIGGTINLQGFLNVKVTKIGEDTFLSQVIKLVEECQGSKVPIQKFADKVTSVFVPIVIIVAIATFILWISFPTVSHSLIQWASHYLPWVSPNLPNLSLAIFASIAVLVIACPCALGLATPTALMVSSARGAKLGILFRSGEAIQTLKDIKTIVFDKTGTITKGKPEITDILSVHNLSENEILSLSASLEQGSEHPLSKAFLEKAKEQKLSLSEPQNFSSLSGMGIHGTINNDDVLLGNKTYLEKEHIQISKDLELKMTTLENEGKTVILIVVNKIVAGIIAIADTVKEDSQKAIQQLKGMGLTTVMLTGDNERTAKAISRIVGIDKVIANVLPDKKLEAIQTLQKQELVAMVGDGINDAPALTQANVGIAIGTGTDIAIEASDVTLVKGNLLSVVQAIKLSQATFKKIKENLFWAFFYNIVAIPLAMLGLLHPIIAEAAMGFSSVNVVTNSMKLKKIKL